MSKRSLNFARATPHAAALVAAAALALAAAGCGGGGGGGGGDDHATATHALTGLYVIDHDGKTPTGNALAPYEAALRKVQDDCTGGAEDLASSIQSIAFRASNGSGTRITNLEALHAVGRYLKRNPRPKQDCSGVFVGVEAYLEGGSLEG